MHMIDHLMMAYTVEMISIEKVVDSVKRFSTFSSSQELPFDLEDAMIFWINKVQIAAQLGSRGATVCGNGGSACRVLRVGGPGTLVSATSVVCFAGEHEDEGDDGEGAQSQASSTGVPQSSEGKAASWFAFTKMISKHMTLLSWWWCADRWDL